ncbi:endonuclease domain of the non-LTR retrotransposon LINE-1 [Elysia marginata]|uniref:Endonuclease domain of the non-LTR retrotransposon LINE-1 n=1 Tax=Elysia marginata TaxID=1093978 RepID=A0AAV4GQM6_9GAST|nr:endonuclease domain of the non-LTR retrotransposon LINE-1 [Elysia marginata]
MEKVHGRSVQTRPKHDIKEFEENNYEKVPLVTNSEARKAINELASGKSPGADEIPIELLKDVGDEIITTMAAVCNAILYILVLRLTIQAAILNHQNNIAFNKGQHMLLSLKPAHLIHTLTDENFNGTVRVVTTTTEKQKQTRQKHGGGTRKKLWALGNSDHSLVYLRPKYTPIRHREQPKQKTVLVWTPEIWDELRACFDCTDWNVFVNSTADVSELADTGTVEGKRRRGRQRKAWCDNIKEWTGMAMYELVRCYKVAQCANKPDNSSGQDKNSPELHYFPWRVLTGCPTSITVSFLITELIKFAPDLMFRLIKHH